MRLTRRIGPDYRARARGRLLRLFVWSSCLVALLTLRPFVAAEEARPGFSEDDPRIKTSAPIFFDRVETIRVTPSGRLSDVGVRTANGNSCQFQETYSDADFEGPGDFSILFGIAELETAATSHILAPEFFPIEIQSVEMVFAQTGSLDLVTELELLIFKGTPDQGQIVATIPHTLNFPACDDGIFCNGAEACTDGVCVSGLAPCSGQFCNEDLEACVECFSAVDCDDANDCTVDTCNASGQCEFTIDDGASCDDGDGCTANDTCDSGGQCVGEPCDDGLFCNGQESCVADVCTAATPPCAAELCDEKADECECVEDIDCDDSNPCTDDTCAGSVCQFSNNSLGCDDLNSCTTDDVCAGGSCAGTPTDCNDGDPCTQDTCNPANGQCSHPAVQCLADQLCEPGTGDCVDCLDDADCDDGLFCNGIETCSLGTCVADTDLPCPGQLCDENANPHCFDSDQSCGAINILMDLSAAPVTVENNGTDTFSVGFRIVEHNNQTQNPCSFNPPPDNNAFPTVDTNGVADGVNNWFWLLNCGPLGCPPAWQRFEDLVFCEPDGDWVMRATWAPLNCDFSIGSCCFGDGHCEPGMVDFVCIGQDGRFLGEDSVCPEFCDGACCFSNGACDVLTSDACEVLDGVYQADGTDCDPDPCPDPQGACCVGDNCFDDTTEADCAQVPDAEWAGPGTVCADDVCALIAGACCLPNGTCQNDVLEKLCVAQGGNYKGDDTNCAAEECLGACCFGTLCLGDASGPSCADSGGTWHGPLTSCDDKTNPCLVDPLDGACCPADGGVCQVLGENDCSVVGDTWFGPGSSCDFVECDQPLGACCGAGDACTCLDNLSEVECLAANGEWGDVGSTCADDCETCEACCSPITGSCVDLTTSDCLGFGANPQGEGTTCATTACPVVVGACCSADGTFCEILQQFQCVGLAGNWQGPDTICEGFDCSAIGACCFVNETCAELQFPACDSQGGEYLGDGTDCIPSPCGPVGCQNDGDCSDNNQCNGIETCVGETCSSGMPLNCDDDDACTDDNCDAALGCVHNTTDCDDGNDCTIDSCDSAVGCIHTTIFPCCGNGEVEEGEECDPPDGETCDDNCQLILTGACCQGETCGESQTADQCAAGGGDYQGDETTCDPDPCVPALEACCNPDTGSCSDLTPNQCVASGNDPQGPGTDCDSVECPLPPTGACCSADGTFCEILEQSECADLAGTWQGPATTCDGLDCAAMGACCLAGGSCDALQIMACEFAGGSYQGDGTVCEAGVCCVSDPDCDDGNVCNGTETCLDNVCQEGKPLDCDDGDDCTDDPCDPLMGCDHTPIEPCCGNGITEEGEQCDPPDGKTCDENCQLFPTGACCYITGTCQEDVSENSCKNAGGIWQGEGAICEPDLCPGCTPNKGAAENDCCADADLISTGLTNFNTTNANTDGPIHLGACEFDGQTYNDIWYQYTADCTADTIVTTCEDLGGSADYDTDLVVYDSCDCDNLVLLGCDDDDQGHPCGFDPLYQSTVMVPMIAGNCYMVRVGGWFDEDFGTGTLLIDPQCGACCQGDACVDNQGSQECADAGGVFQGTDSACLAGGGDIDCTITGACCTVGGGCAEITPQGCAEQSGDYQGDGTACDPNPCGCGDCPTDVNGDGETGPFDLAFLLGNWGPVGPDAECLDANSDKLIGPFDLAFLLGNWGPCE